MEKCKEITQKFYNFSGQGTKKTGMYLMNLCICMISLMLTGSIPFRKRRSRSAFPRGSHSAPAPVRIAKRYTFLKIKNAGSRNSLRTRFGRNASDYDLHEKAGGLPLQTITAPNIRRLSKQGREVCKQERKLTSRNRKCGSKKTRYAPSRK